MTFVDGTGITPGTEGCRCRKDCEHPCWMRIGIGKACGACDCDPLPEFPEIGQRHWSRFVIVPLSWLLDRTGLHSKSDDLDALAERRGWWHR